MRRASALCALAALSAVCLASRSALAQAPAASDWGYYGGDAFGQRFSSLDQINRGNVARLSVAWTYRTGELGAGLASAGKLTFEATPVLAFDLLYLETATNVVIALDPETGKLRWRFDPHVDRTRHYAEASSRGVSVWQAVDAGSGECRRRVFTGTLDARLLALDADTGRPCAGFGDGGQVDLTRGLRIRDAGAYLVTSPPVLYGKVVIVGSAIGDNRATDVERGVIRGYDAESGVQLWSFDPLPDSPSHPAAPEWKLAQALATGAGNAWGVMSVDKEQGLVLIPTGSASPDYYGGERIGSDRFADSLLALDARSGQLVWQQQLVHHDLWDYDLAAQPVLGDVMVAGVPVPAVIEATKTGMVYVFGRKRGQPLFPISERQVPVSRVPGEHSWPTQPFPLKPGAISRISMTREEVSKISPETEKTCKEQYDQVVQMGPYTPYGMTPSLVFPSSEGGGSWSGASFDPMLGYIFVNTRSVGTLAKLNPSMSSGVLPSYATMKSRMFSESSNSVRESMMPLAA